MPWMMVPLVILAGVMLAIPAATPRWIVAALLVLFVAMLAAMLWIGWRARS